MITEFESRILILTNGMADRASNGELFASGYLHGHLTLAIVKLESNDDCSTQAAHTTASQSSEKTTSADELPSRDQALVTDIWEYLSQQVSRQ